MINARDFAIALNSLRKAKGYVITIVLTLGVTLGTLVAMFNLNYQLLMAPLPYPDADQLVVMQTNTLKAGQPAWAGAGNVSPYPVLVEGYKQSDDYFAQKALINFYVDVVRSFSDTPQVNTAYITPEYLQVLQPAMALGRIFSSEEGLDSHQPLAVISFKTWQNLFNKDPAILGKSIRFGDVDFKIIGVTADTFPEPQIVEVGRETDVWLPWDYNLVTEDYRSWGSFVDHEYLVGKLKTGYPVAEAERDLTVRLNKRFKDENAATAYYSDFSLVIELFNYHRVILGDSSSKTTLLFLGALVLLLIAAANITNLILARAASQQRNMAIQAALGAQKSHLFNAVLAEVFLLMAGATFIALAIAFGGVGLLKNVAAESFPRLSELHLSLASIAFSVLVAVALAIVFALLVSHQINYRALNSLLQSSGKGVGIQISSKVRKLLILIQVALAGLLLAVNLHLFQSAIHHLLQPLGLAVDNLYEVELNIGQEGAAPREERKRNLMAIRDLLQAHPKVEDASLTHFFPIGQNSGGTDRATIADNPEFKDQKMAIVTFVDERYLGLYEIPLISGRHFNANEFQDTTHAIILNETLAKILQADGQVVGKRFHTLFGEPYLVVGVVKDLNLPGGAEESRMFVPQANVEFPRLLIKMKPNQAFSKPELNELMAKVNGQYKASILLSMNQGRDMLLAKDRLSAALTAALSLVTFCLAGIGVYGVLSYSILLRRFELGIRMAIGARPQTIFLQVLKDNLVPVVGGLLVALTGLVLLVLWVRNTTYDGQLNLLSWTIPTLMILVLVVVATLLSVWGIIRRPAIFALQNH